MKLRLYGILIGFQVFYYLITSVWPLVDMKSFMAVTGPKTDTWLVKTVAVLLISISAGIVIQVYLNTPRISVFTLAVTAAAGLLAIDLYYALNGIIPKIYLFDALAQIFLIFLWIIVLLRSPKNNL